MQVTRKIAAAAAVATVATLGLATVVSANMIDDTKSATGGVTEASPLKGYGKGGKHWYWVHKNGSLVSITDTNLGPFQACHNNVPINAVGAQVPVHDITGIVGLSNAGNSVTAVKTCEQESKANTHGKWYRVSDGGLVEVADTNVGPFQACHNDVPINAVGAQVPVNDIAAILGLTNYKNSVDVLKTCEQESAANTH
jgi:hypothetical protein